MPKFIVVNQHKATECAAVMSSLQNAPPVLQKTTLYCTCPHGQHSGTWSQTRQRLTPFSGPCRLNCAQAPLYVRPTLYSFKSLVVIARLQDRCWAHRDSNSGMELRRWSGALSPWEGGSQC